MSIDKSPGRSTFVKFPQAVDFDNSRQVSVTNRKERINDRFYQKTNFYRSKRNNCTQRRYKKVFYIRRGKYFVKKECDRTGSKDIKKTGILQHDFPSTEETRRSPTYFKSKTIKPVCCSTSLQDGNSAIYSKEFENWRLGRNIGPKGCVFPSAYSSGSQAISSFQCVRQSVPISSSAVRSQVSAKNFHQSHGRDRCLSEKAADSCIYVFRRLDVKKPEQSIVNKSVGLCSELTEKPRSDNKSREIVYDTDTDIELFRSSNSFEGGPCISLRGEIPKYMSNDTHDVKFGLSRSTCNVKTTWADGFLHRSSSLGSFTHETNTVIPPGMVETISTRTELQDPIVQPYKTTSCLVAEQDKLFQRGEVGTRVCSSDIDNRCITARLGSPFKHLSHSRSLARSLQHKTYKLAGTESCSVSSSNLCEICEGQDCSYQDRQFNCCQLHKQARRDTVTRSLLPNLGVNEMVHISQHRNSGCSYPGEKEYSSRCFVEGEKNYTHDRMVIRHDSCQPVISAVRHSGDRPLCHLSEQETACLLFPDSGGKGNICRCIVNELDRDVRIRLSPTDNIKQSLTKDSDAQLCSSANCPDVAKTVMVQSSSGSVNRLSSKTSCSRKSFKSKRSVPSRSSCFQSCSMESLKKSYIAKGFSPKIASVISNARKQSTQTVYNARLKLFSSWCQERNINPASSTVPEIAEFLMFLHSVKKCKPRTLAGYRSAISLIHNSKDKISMNSELRNLIKGLFNTNPTIRQLAPNWNLPLVLLMLTKTPFEPLEDSELKFLTMKTVFLVALASAARVSEIHSFTINENHFRREHNGIRLLPNMQFLAKTQTLLKPWEPVFIPKFDNYATDDTDLLLCPCRTLLHYIKRTKSLRKSDRLFLTYQKNHHVEASKDSIARWIVQTVRYAYENADSEILQTVRAHDTRKLSTSWALFNGLSSEEILKAAHWASETTFTSFYLRDVPDSDSRFARAAILQSAKRQKKKY